MYILNKRNRYSDLLHYIGITVFCGIFGTVYEYYSHGVYSIYMQLMFLFPLMGGIIPNVLQLIIPRIPKANATVKKLWNCGVATLTIGSAMTGVFEIYGGAVPILIGGYWLAGILLAGIALNRYLSGK
ncbi:MAG: hypothetical protein KA965_05245 [Butyrivibrio sp.]|nr:hypothetical protein [Butyrivibrio sp.]